MKKGDLFTTNRTMTTKKGRVQDTNTYEIERIEANGSVCAFRFDKVHKYGRPNPCQVFKPVQIVEVVKNAQ